MSKLTIQHLEHINRHWIALQFQGDDQAFRAMTELLRRQKRYNAYWESERWVCRVAWLEQHRSRFANLDRMLVMQRQSS
jgi:hypothetical protein